MFPGSAAKGAARWSRRPRQALEAKTVKRRQGLIDSGACLNVARIDRGETGAASSTGRSPQLVIRWVFLPDALWPVVERWTSLDGRSAFRDDKTRQALGGALLTS